MLRSARFDDADAVATVLIESRLAFLPFAPSAHPEQDIRSWMRNHLLASARVVVCEEDGQIVGVLATSEEGQKSWIDQLYVLPGWTGRGIGSRLLEHAHRRLPRSIHLYTFQQNAGARRFYERSGYQPIEFTDGQDNEEKCPDVLYVLAGAHTEAVDGLAIGGSSGAEPSAFDPDASRETPSK